MEHPSSAILTGPGVFLPQLMLPAWADSPESANPKVRQSLPPHLVHTAASVNSLVFPGLPSLAKLNPGAAGWGCLQVLLSGIFMKRADTANGSSRDFLETLETFYWSCLFWAESSFFLFGLISHCTSRSLNESPVMSVPDRRAPRHSLMQASSTLLSWAAVPQLSCAQCPHHTPLPLPLVCHWSDSISPSTKPQASVQWHKLIYLLTKATLLFWLLCEFISILSPSLAQWESKKGES